MQSDFPIKVSVDKKHFWIGDYCYTFEQAKQKAHEILDKINGQEDRNEIKNTEDATGID